MVELQRLGLTGIGPMIPLPIIDGSNLNYDPSGLHAVFVQAFPLITGQGHALQLNPVIVGLSPSNPNSALMPGDNVA